MIMTAREPELRQRMIGNTTSLQPRYPDPGGNGSKEWIQASGRVTVTGKGLRTHHGVVNSKSVRCGRHDAGGKGECATMNRDRIESLWKAVVDGSSFQQDRFSECYEILSSADYLYIQKKIYPKLQELIAHLTHLVETIDARGMEDLVTIKIGHAVWFRERDGVDPGHEGLNYLLRLRNRSPDASFSVIAEMPDVLAPKSAKIGPIVIGPKAQLTKEEPEAIQLTQLECDTACRFSLHDDPHGLMWTTFARTGVQRLNDGLWLWARAYGDNDTFVYPSESPPMGAAIECHGEFTGTHWATHSRLVANAMGQSRLARILLTEDNVSSWLRNGLLEVAKHFVTPKAQVPLQVQQILAAIQWYGRAAWQVDSCVVILCCASALESLFPSREYSKAERLATEARRVCADGTFEIDMSVQPIDETVRQFYGIRNHVVHAGSHPEEESWRYRARHIVQGLVVNASMSLRG